MANPKQEIIDPEDNFMLFEQGIDPVTEDVVFGQGVFDGGVFFSTALTEDHNYSNIITSHPVEADSDISDNVRPEQIILSVDAIYSPLPDALTGTLDAVQVEEDRKNKKKKVQDIFNKLVHYRDSKELLTITTSLHFYESMLIESLTIPRDNTAGLALLFSITFKQIRFVDSEFLVVKTKINRAKPNKPGNNKLGKDSGYLKGNKEGGLILKDGRIILLPGPRVKRAPGGPIAPGSF